MSLRMLLAFRFVERGTASSGLTPPMSVDAVGSSKSVARRIRPVQHGAVSEGSDMRWWLLGDLSPFCVKTTSCVRTRRTPLLFADQKP